MMQLTNAPRAAALALLAALALAGCGQKGPLYLPPAPTPATAAPAPAPTEPTVEPPPGDAAPVAR